MISIPLSLSEIEPFSTLNQNELKKIVLSFEKKDFPASSSIIEQGGFVSSIGVIVDGSAKIIMNDYQGYEIVCGYLNKGDILIDIGLFSNSPASATISFCEDSTILCIEKDDFVQHIETFSSLKSYFYGIAANNIRQCCILYCNNKSNYKNTIPESKKTKNKDNYLYQAQKFIDNNYYKPITLEMVAQETAMSKYHFCRSFKKHFGTSFKHYLNKKRIEAAKKLLSQHGASVADAGFAVGFNDASYFSRVFKEFEGYPPKQLHKKEALS